MKNPKIPKIIHYCWFGGQPLPDSLQRCLKTWSILKDYRIMRWDESNCDFTENEFVRRTYQDRQWGFIGDYYRLKAVYEYGGIYLDTDIKVYRDFDDLLDHPAFLGFIYDCAVGASCIGARPGNPFIKALLDMYEATVFTSSPGPDGFERLGDKLLVRRLQTSNYYYTYYVLQHYPQFRLDNTYQDLGDFVIYPKECFEIGNLAGSQYVIHLNTGSWRAPAPSGRIRQAVKRCLGRHEKLFDKVQIVVRHFRYQKIMKQIPFYPSYLAQKRGEPRPNL